MASKRRHMVAAVVSGELAPSELAVACELFGIDRSDLGVPWSRFMVCPAEPTPPRTASGCTIDTPYGIVDVRPADPVVREDFGAEVASAVARRMVGPPHRDGGQAQYVQDPMPTGNGADLFADTIAWLQDHLHEAVTVEDLAGRSAMSPRTFARRFRA